ncbi:MAG: type II toxin-antitoxin system prevent-host-death family antitoxin [Micrococcales bacterium]|nr:type II toxin-antitoxin system prevent-host-death family antitoxin [Micrococcales bacterium]
MTTIETTYSQARQSLKSLLDRVVDDRVAITIRRRGGRDVAMISADELTSLEETAYLLRSPANAERLLTALNRSRTATLEPMALSTLEQLVEGDGHR